MQSIDYSEGQLQSPQSASVVFPSCMPPKDDDCSTLRNVVGLFIYPRL